MTIAKDLASLIDAIILSTDKIRKELISRPTYTKQERKSIYDVLILVAKYLHNARLTCILDATFITEKSRRELKEKLSLAPEQMCIIECICPDNIVIARLRQRRNDYSDADISIYRKMKKIYEPVKGQHIIAETGKESSKSVAKEIAGKILSGRCKS